MGEHENNQKTKNNDLDERSINLLIDKKIAEAKVLVAEKRLNFLLAIGAAFLTIFGIIIPMFLSQQSEKKVDTAIERMENRFKELAGKQLRKPEIACYVDGKDLVNSIIHLDYAKKRSQSIVIKNVGDGAAENVTMRLYLAGDHEYLHSILQSFDFRFPAVNDKPEFKVVYGYEREPFVLPAQDSFSTHFEMSQPQLITKDTRITALLKIFYGEPAPVEIPFTIELKKPDNKTLQ
jgi:hypothetical protein